MRTYHTMQVTKASPAPVVQREMQRSRSKSHTRNMLELPVRTTVC